jgi:hypothetical protein
VHGSHCDYASSCQRSLGSTALCGQRAKAKDVIRPVCRRSAGFGLVVEEQITSKPERSEIAVVALCALDKLWRVWLRCISSMAYRLRQKHPCARLERDVAPDRPMKPRLGESGLKSGGSLRNPLPSRTTCSRQPNWPACPIITSPLSALVAPDQGWSIPVLGC